MRAKQFRSTSRQPLLHLIARLALGVVCVGGCDSDDADDEAGEQPPDAPQMLAAEELSGGAHLTWVDASDDETEFMIMRMDVAAGGEYETITTVPFDTTQYHDAPLMAGVTYMYMVMAMNDAGTSESNEVEFTLP